MEEVPGDQMESPNTREEAGPGPVPPEEAGPGPVPPEEAGPSPVPPEEAEPGPLLPEEAEPGPVARARQVASVRPPLESFSPSLSNRRMSKFRRSTSGVQSLQETLKEKQARYRDAREGRKMKISASFRYIFEILGDKLGLDATTVEDMILDGPSLQAFDNFFAKDGSRTLKFLYQEGEAPGVECGRTIPGVVKGTKIMRLYLDTAPDKFKGLCLFFVRYRNDIPLNAKSIHEDIYFCVLDATEGLLRGTRNMLANIFLPAILATNNWGTLSQTTQGTTEKQNFIETINRYLSFLNGARVSIEGTVELKKMDHIDFSKLQSFEEVTAAAANSDTVHQLEEVLMIWYKQIEQVLIESEQMRKEADDSGPLTELEHWKRMSAKFNFIIEQIKGPSCKAVINVLNVGHSKLLKMWRELDARITDTANESKDNVRYLYTLEKVCQPLYNYDLVSMAHGIQNLINAIRMIHSVSRYYNTSERMTSLFIKVTNQMVTACKAYITDGGLSRVWDQDTPVVIKKIQVCMVFQFLLHQPSQGLFSQDCFRKCSLSSIWELYCKYLYNMGKGFIPTTSSFPEQAGVLVSRFFLSWMTG
uniref:Dynein heavy chain tail domain-containing protein n=1 Tax=Chelonoidis abingdonii TaxID=106734 RepID=A0A8C0G760_CHEAB